MRERSHDLIDVFGELIHVYTRARAIADGVLFDVSDVAGEMGFRVPMATTAAVWSDCVTWSADDSDSQITQDEHGRLWDLLWSAFNSARCARGQQRIPNAGRSRTSACPRSINSIRPKISWTSFAYSRRHETSRSFASMPMKGKAVYVSTAGIRLRHCCAMQSQSTRTSLSCWSTTYAASTATGNGHDAARPA